MAVRNNMHDIGVIPIDYQLPTQDCETLKSVRLPIFKDSLVNIFSSPNLEELVFPNLYPYGTHGLRHERAEQPSIAQYFKCRLLNKDKRWISSPQYIFWALHIYEQQKLQDAITTALRIKTKVNQNITVENVNSSFGDEFNMDDYMFMKQMRRTAAYWKK